MKIFIIAMDDPIFYGPIVSKIIKSCGADVVGVGKVPRPMGGKDELSYYFRFWGMLAFFSISFKMLFKKFTGQDDPIKEAKKKGIPTFEWNDKSEIYDVLDEYKPDVIVAFVPFIVPADLLAKAQFWLNTHCGPLPKYAGLDAPFWSMLNEEKELAITIHKMSTKLDEGVVLSQKFIPNTGHYFPMLFDLFKIAADEHVRLIKSNYQAELPELRYSERTYNSRPTIEDGKKFKKMGLRFL